MKQKLLIGMTFMLVGIISLSSFKEKETNSERGFYYCFFTGNYNNDGSDDAAAFSSIREFDSEPDITCQRWKDFVESRERGFKGYCNTFKVIGPFKFGHEANLSQEKRVKAYKDGGYKIVQFGGRWP